MTLAQLANDLITLVKRDGSEHAAKALVRPGKILVFDMQFPVAVGDEIRHALPSGVEQRFEVLDPGFVGGPAQVRHYEITVRNVASREPAPAVINHHSYYNSGIANVMGPNGTSSGNSNRMDRPATGAPQLPDIRVLVSPGFAQHANGALTDLLIVDVQNHSPNPFYLATIKLMVADGRTGIFMHDDATGSPNAPTTVMSGDSHSLRISVKRLRNMDVLFDRAIVVDKIGRKFESDPAMFSSTLKTLGLR